MMISCISKQKVSNSEHETLVTGTAKSFPNLKNSNLTTQITSWFCAQPIK